MFEGHGIQMGERQQNNPKMPCLKRAKGVPRKENGVGQEKAGFKLRSLGGSHSFWGSQWCRATPAVTTAELGHAQSTHKKDKS